MPAEWLYNKKPTAEFESMDVSGGESAPEPDVVMDSDTDFDPVSQKMRQYLGTSRLPEIFRRHKLTW